MGQKARLFVEEADRLLGISRSEVCTVKFDVSTDGYEPFSPCLILVELLRLEPSRAVVTESSLYASDS